MQLFKSLFKRELEKQGTYHFHQCVMSISKDQIWVWIGVNNFDWNVQRYMYSNHGLANTLPITIINCLLFVKITMTVLIKIQANNKIRSFQNISPDLSNYENKTVIGLCHQHLGSSWPSEIAKHKIRDITAITDEITRHNQCLLL